MIVKLQHYMLFYKNDRLLSFACNFQDWGCVILREIDFLLKICWSRFLAYTHRCGKYILNQNKCVANQRKWVTNNIKRVTKQIKCVSNKIKCVVNQIKCVTEQSKCITEQSKCVTKRRKCVTKQIAKQRLAWLSSNSRFPQPTADNRILAVSTLSRMAFSENVRRACHCS